MDRVRSATEADGRFLFRKCDPSSRADESRSKERINSYNVPSRESARFVKLVRRVESDGFGY